MNVAKQFVAILTPSEQKRGGALMIFMAIGMVMEAVGVGAVIPAVVLLTGENPVEKYPALRPLLTLLGNPTQGKLVITGMLALVFVYLIKTTYLAWLTWRQTKFGYEIQANLSQRLFATYLGQPYTFHLERNSAQLIRNAINEVNQFTFSILLPLLMLLSEGFVLLGIGTLLLLIEPLGTSIIVIVLGGASWFFYKVTRARISRWGVARQHHEGLRLQHLQQGLGGAKEVKLFGREAEFLEMYRAHNLKSSRMTQYQVTLQLLPRLWLELLAVLSLAILVITLVAQQRTPASIMAALGLFAAAAFRLMPSVNRVLNAVQAIRFGMPVIEMLQRELALAVPNENRTTKSGHFMRGIEVREVDYKYPGSGSYALSKCSLQIRSGESVGVIGPSGSGKTTLVDVILGLLEPCAGGVYVDGYDVSNDLRSWQNQVGYVPQSVYLTDDTLRRNVAFGLADELIDDQAVARALRAAQLIEFVAALPRGAETVVGERGVRLSGGQRQRIGIARALYHNPAVLVLDEATSALDTDTEAGVIEAVTALQGEKTILIVAHRLSTVEHCDRLYRLEGGRVVAQGPPSKLIGLNV